MTTLSDGNHMLVFMGLKEENLADLSDIYGQIIDEEGEASGDAWRLNSDVKGQQVAPFIGSFEDGGYVVG